MLAKLVRAFNRVSVEVKVPFMFLVGAYKDMKLWFLQKTVKKKKKLLLLSDI